MAYCYRCGKIIHEKSSKSDDDSIEEQIVKEAIKEAIHAGMIFIPCVSCGETWFVPANLKNISAENFICNKCIIQKQRLKENK